MPAYSAVNLAKATCRRISVQQVYGYATTTPYANSPSAGTPDIVQWPGLGIPAGTAIVALDGPVLGSMDSSDAPATITCTSNGILITVSLEQSSKFNGVAFYNILWQPRLTFMVSGDSSILEVTAEWVMYVGDKLTDRPLIASALSPRVYPVFVNATVRVPQEVQPLDPRYNDASVPPTATTSEMAAPSDVRSASRSAFLLLVQGLEQKLLAWFQGGVRY
jgi:hypothetical protein